MSILFFLLEKQMHLPFVKYGFKFIFKSFWGVLFRKRYCKTFLITKCWISGIFSTKNQIAILKVLSIIFLIFFSSKFVRQKSKSYYISSPVNQSLCLYWYFLLIISHKKWLNVGTILNKSECKLSLTFNKKSKFRHFRKQHIDSFYNKYLSDRENKYLHHRICKIAARFLRYLK